MNIYEIMIVIFVCFFPDRGVVENMLRLQIRLNMGSFRGDGEKRYFHRRPHASLSNNLATYYGGNCDLTALKSDRRAGMDSLLGRRVIFFKSF